MQKSVLVVDDDPLFLELMQEVLEHTNYKTFPAYNGVEALQLLDRQSVDAIVSDVEMPLMNGILFHKKVSENERYRTIPFVFLTSTEDPEKLAYIHSLPEAKLLQKSDMIDGLLDVISAVIA